MFTIHRAEERGTNDIGWLRSKFSFSFADYYNPSRMGFGALRVLNNDVVAAGQGFGAHPHKNMEIITIPLIGELTHKDDTGNEKVIRPGDVQVMSAGSGIVHSEMNNSDQDGEFLQIWIEPHTFNVFPRYDQKHFTLEKNTFTRVASGERDDSLFIYQHAIILLGKSDAGKFIHYEGEHTGLFLFVIEGSLHFEGQVINTRDSLEIAQISRFGATAKEDCRLLLIEVPL